MKNVPRNVMQKKKWLCKPSVTGWHRRTILVLVRRNWQIREPAVESGQVKSRRLKWIYVWITLFLFSQSGASCWGWGVVGTCSGVVLWTSMKLPGELQGTETVQVGGMVGGMRASLSRPPVCSFMYSVMPLIDVSPLPCGKIITHHCVRD